MVLIPTATFCKPIVLLLNEQNPTAVLFDAVLVRKDWYPTATLFAPAPFEYNASLPTATLFAPVVENSIALLPTAVLLLTLLYNKAPVPIAVLSFPVVLA